jgi:DNA replicative helicase MCM subunit Mcm2 (Cdc46/Mcm family)
VRELRAAGAFKLNVERSEWTDYQFAHVRSSDDVTKEDVGRELSLVRKLMQQVGYRPGDGRVRRRRCGDGATKTQRDRHRKVIAVIEEANGLTIEEKTEILDIDSEKVEHEVERLKQQD